MRNDVAGAVEASLIPSPAAQRRICLDKSVVICACVSRPIIEMRNSARITQICLHFIKEMIIIFNAFAKSVLVENIRSTVGKISFKVFRF